MNTLPNEIISIILSFLNQKQRITIIPKVCKKWNNIFITGEDNYTNYKVEGLKYSECKTYNMYNFIGYNITYNKLYKLMKKIPSVKIYEDPKLNEYMINNYSTQIIVNNKYQQDDIKERFYIGIILNPIDKYAKLFIKSLKITNMNKNKLYKCIINNIQIYKRRFIFYCAKYTIDKNKDTNPIFCYLYYVLYLRNISLNEFLTKYNITIDKLVNMIYPDCNIASLKTIYDIKYLSKRKIYFLILDI